MSTVAVCKTEGGRALWFGSFPPLIIVVYAPASTVYHSPNFRTLKKREKKKILVSNVSSHTEKEKGRFSFSWGVRDSLLPAVQLFYTL